MARPLTVTVASMGSAGLQELQTDLHTVMRLAKRSAEYQLAVYMGAGSQYVKHRDALPDDGADPNQRRVGSAHCAVHALSLLLALSRIHALLLHACLSRKSCCRPNAMCRVVGSYCCVVACTPDAFWHQHRYCSTNAERQRMGSVLFVN